MELWIRSQDKAIEYINKRTEEYNHSDKISRPCISDWHYKKLIDDLFNILQGDELND